MKNILVICTGNTCRSPMAEGIIKRLADERGMELNVKSGGLAANIGDAPSENAVRALEEIGIDISETRSKPVTLEDLRNADRIYVMTLQHKRAVLNEIGELKAPVETLNVPDPYGGDLEQYRRCRDNMLDYFSKELTVDNIDND